MFGERTLHTRRKDLQNKIEERVEESDKTAVLNMQNIVFCFCLSIKIFCVNCSLTGVTLTLVELEENK